MAITSRPKTESSALHRAGNNETHDIVCVGFGPAAVAFAIALHDAIASNDPSLKTHNPKVRFIESQPEFAWHPGMLLEDSKMQIHFVKDLASLRNPRSKFTFINYLHNQGRLVQFTNVGELLPSRLEYNDYMTWCASAFDDVVDYSRRAVRIEAVESDSLEAAVNRFRVISRCHKTGEETAIESKHVIVAAGGRPAFPKELQLQHPRIIHSSQYVTQAARLLEKQPQRIAVVGAGQSAAEIFYDIPSRFPGTQSVLLTRGAALRPSDDSPFVNEIFDPSSTDDFYHQDSATRAQTIIANRATNYGVVRLELIERIYSQQYQNSVKRLPEESWPHRIFNHSTVEKVEPKDDNLQIQIKNSSKTYSPQTHVPEQSSLTVDMVIVATGYERSQHEELMQDLLPLRPEEDVESWSVGRNYAVKFREGALEPGRGIWLQGCNQKTHGLSDSLLSVISVRAGEMVENIFKQPQIKGVKPSVPVLKHVKGFGEKKELVDSVVDILPTPSEEDVVASELQMVL